MIQLRRLVLLSTFVIAGCGRAEETPSVPAVVGNCNVLVAEKIGADAAPLGFTAKQAAARYPVDDDYILLYGYDPATASSSDFAVGIEAIDVGRVHFVRQAVEVVGNVEVPCPQALTFPAVIRLVSADGFFDERVEVDLLAYGLDDQEWTGYLPLSELRGRFLPARESGLTHRGFYFGGRFRGGSSVGGISLASDGNGGTRLVTVGFWGEDPPER